jgi:hypothetical protein
MKDKVEKIVQGLPFTKWQQFAEKEKRKRNQREKKIIASAMMMMFTYGMKTQNDGE